MTISRRIYDEEQSYGIGACGSSFGFWWCGICRHRSVKRKAISADTLNKFRQQTVDLREKLRAKNLELRELYAYDSINMRQVDELEGDIEVIKAKIGSVAASMNLEPCNCL